MISQKTQADLDLLSKESSIPLWFFYLIQGDFPTVPAYNFVQAKKQFQLCHPDSIEANLLAHQMISHSVTLVEAAIAAKLVGHMNDKLHWLSFKHWNQVAVQVVTNTSVKDELLDLLQLVPNKSLAHDLLIKKLIEYPLSENESELVFCHLVSELGDYQELLSIWLQSTTDLVAIAKIFHYSLHGSEVKGEAWEKWNLLSREAIAQTNKIAEVSVLLKQFPSGGPAMEYAAKKVLELS